MNQKTSKSATTTKITRYQARGVERRVAILAAAKEVLETDEKDSFSMYSLANHAGIPPSSLYHFFAKKEDIFIALLEQIFVDFESIVQQPIDEDGIHSWTDIAVIIERRLQAYYQNNKLARMLILGEHADAYLHFADHKNDEKLGKVIEQIYTDFFNLPKLPTEFNIFSIALQIADKVYSLSHSVNGEITETMLNEGLKVSMAYLSQYLPAQLQKKPSAKLIAAVSPAGNDIP